MNLISENIKKFLEVHKLGFVATVSSDHLPNISPKGTIIGWNSDTLAFANIRSPDTLQNIRNNPSIEINVIDPLLRKGFLFRGKSRIIEEGELYQNILSHYRKKGIKSPINEIVLVDISSIEEVTSPLYDLGVSEEEIKSKWKKFFQEL